MANMPMTARPKTNIRQLCQPLSAGTLPHKGCQPYGQPKTPARAIAAAFKRREVYASSGPRIGLQFFAGWSFTKKDATQTDLARIGYRKGVPMGGELDQAKKGQRPSFLIQAAKDPLSHDLEIVQIIKVAGLMQRQVP